MKQVNGISTETKRLAIEAIDHRIKFLMPAASHASDTDAVDAAKDAYETVTKLFEARAELAKSLGSAGMASQKPAGAKKGAGGTKAPRQARSRRAGLPAKEPAPEVNPSEA